MIELPRQPTNRDSTYKTSWLDIADALEEQEFTEVANIVRAWANRQLVSVSYVNTLLEVSKARQDLWKKENDTR